MIMFEPFFDVWKSRSRYLSRAFDQISFLTPDDQFMQAILIRNACMDYLMEIEVSFNSIHANFVAHQEETYIAEVDEVEMLNFNKRPWPLDQDVPQKVKEMKGDLALKVQLWRTMAADFEARMLAEKKERKNEVHVTIGKLMKTYGVSRRD